MKRDPTPSCTQGFFFFFFWQFMACFFKGVAPHRLTMLQWVGPPIWTAQRRINGSKTKGQSWEECVRESQALKVGRKIIIIKIHCLYVWSSQRTSKSLYKNFSALEEDFFLLHFIGKLKLWDYNKLFKIPNVYRGSEMLFDSLLTHMLCPLAEADLCPRTHNLWQLGAAGANIWCLFH